MKNNRGFTLIEILLGMSLGIIGLYALSTGQLNSQKLSHAAWVGQGLQDTANLVRMALNDPAYCARALIGYTPPDDAGMRVPAGSSEVVRVEVGRGFRTNFHHILVGGQSVPSTANFSVVLTELDRNLRNLPPSSNPGGTRYVASLNLSAARPGLSPVSLSVPLSLDTDAEGVLTSCSTNPNFSGGTASVLVHSEELIKGALLPLLVEIGPETSPPTSLPSWGFVPHDCQFPPLWETPMPGDPGYTAPPAWQAIPTATLQATHFPGRNAKTAILNVYVEMANGNPGGCGPGKPRFSIAVFSDSNAVVRPQRWKKLRNVVAYNRGDDGAFAASMSAEIRVPIDQSTPDKNVYWSGFTTGGWGSMRVTLAGFAD
ncbi:MAG: prepilin-type N-terminal cleavage/methylation domain-containing protein [Bacteriovoracia bacterium]